MKDPRIEKMERRSIIILASIAVPIMAGAVVYFLQTGKILPLAICTVLAVSAAIVRIYILAMYDKKIKNENKTAPS